MLEKLVKLNIYFWGEPYVLMMGPHVLIVEPCFDGGATCFEGKAQVLMVDHRFLFLAYRF